MLIPNIIDVFESNNVKETYHKKIKNKCATGIDRITRENFERNLEDNLDIITKKVFNGSYKFSHYKEKLISKGRDKHPRVISIPTIRDKITLKSTHSLLSNVYCDIPNEIVQTTIHKIKKAIESGHYDSFIKLDIKDFYPSINHKILIQILRNRIEDKKIVTLISNAIKTPTISSSNSKVSIQKRGVPQGLSISNILANIYLKDFDQVHFDSINYKYFRYVDDILILCKEDSRSEIESSLINQFKNLKLKINKEKTIAGIITEGFPFLGYQFEHNKVTVKKSSINKLEGSIIKILSEYKYNDPKNPELFLWKLNLRITGCKNDGKKYGWLFFFSQINDYKLLFKLDWLVKELCKRQSSIFNLVDQTKIKKFVRANKEIINNFTNTKYIPDFSEFTIDEKRFFLSEIIKRKNVQNMSDEIVEQEFGKFIDYSIRGLEKDTQIMS